MAGAATALQIAPTRLAGRYREALTDPDLQKRLPDYGLTPGYEGAEAFASTVKAEQARWKSVIDANNIRAE